MLAPFHISQGIGVCQTGSKKGASPPHPAKGWGAHAVFFGLGVRLWSLSFAFSACSHGLTFTPRTTKKKKPLREISNLCWSFLSALQNPIPTHFSLFRKKHLPNRGAKIRLCARCPVPGGDGDGDGDRDRDRDRPPISASLFLPSSIGSRVPGPTHGIDRWMDGKARVGSHHHRRSRSHDHGHRTVADRKRLRSDPIHLHHTLSELATC